MENCHLGSPLESSRTAKKPRRVGCGMEEEVLIKILLKCLSALLLAVPCAQADTYGLYIVAGQSNTVGLSANVSELTAAEQFQTDVDFRYWTHRDVDLTTGPLRLQSTSLGGGGNSYGPEMTLARALADEAASSGRQVMIIKSAFGGTGLDLDSAQNRPVWEAGLFGTTYGESQPGLSSPNGSAGPGVLLTGPNHYERTIDMVNDAIVDLEGMGHTVAVSGFFWHQGENDGTIQSASNEYGTNFAAMVADARTRFTSNGSANMPFVFGKLRYRTDSSHFTSAVRDGMNGVAAADSRVELVTTDDFFVNDGVHFRNHYDDLGDRFFSAFQRIKDGDTAQLIIEDTTFAGGTWSAAILDVDGTPGGAAASVSQATLNDAGGPLDRRGNVLMATQTVPASSDTRVALIKEDASYDPSISGPILNLNMGANQSEIPSALNNTSAYRYLLLQDSNYYAVENNLHQTLTSYGQRESNGLGDAELAAADFRQWDPVTHDFSIGTEEDIRPDFLSGGEIKFGLLLDTASVAGDTFENYFDDFAVDISYDPDPLLLGDLTGDGSINGADVTKFVANWRLDTSGQSVVVQADLGDLNFNGLVDLADARVLHQALENAGSSASVFDALNGVPEPSSAMLVTLAAAGWLVTWRPRSTVPGYSNFSRSVN